MNNDNLNDNVDEHEGFEELFVGCEESDDLDDCEYEELTLEDLYGGSIHGLEQMAKDFALDRCLVYSYGLWTEDTFILEHNDYKYLVTYISNEKIVVQCVSDEDIDIPTRTMNFDGYVKFMGEADY